MARPEAANQRWSLDFVSDALSRGRRFRGLAVVDDFSRKCLGLVVDTSLPGLLAETPSGVCGWVGRGLDAANSQGGLRGIAERRGCRPAVIVSDNGTELMSHAILRWQEERGVLWRSIAPGKPPDNGCAIAASRTRSWKASTAGSGTSA